MAIHIAPAQFPQDAESILSLFSGYATSLGIDLTFQSFQEELDSLLENMTNPKEALF
jgi:hypothetical protein